MEFEPARCTSCGATIQVPTDRVTARCMICGTEIDVQAAIHARNDPTDAPAQPHWKDVLQVALEYIDSGNFREADAQLTWVLEHEPTNSAVWMCKALIASNPDQVFSYSQKAFDYGFVPPESESGMAERFFVRAYNLIGCVRNPDGSISYERDSAGGQIEEAKRSGFAMGVHCDSAYGYLALALPLLGASYELKPAVRIGHCLNIMERLVNDMPPAGRVVDSPEGYPYEARGWFNSTLPAIYELRQRIRRDFPEMSEAVSAPPQATSKNDDFEEAVSTVLAKLVVGLMGFGVTFGIGVLRVEDKSTCAIVGVIGAVLAMIFVPLNKSE